MIINFLTLFPEYFSASLASSILGRAAIENYVSWRVVKIRDFATDKHQTTDLPPYGGGAGMVMLVEPIDLALQSIGVKKGQPRQKIILTSAKGKILTQTKAQEWSQLEVLTIICGHYEGVDHRVAEFLVDEEVRIGNYVLTGGEPAALVMADAAVRLIPGVLGNQQSLATESHNQPQIGEYPQYSRPADYRGWPVPEVLLSGNHAQIAAWRQQQQLKISD